MVVCQSWRRLARWLKPGRTATSRNKLHWRPALESLELRTVPTTLLVRGDQPGPGFADVIDLDVADSGGVRVTLNGDVTEYAAGQFTDVRVESGGGNDLIHVLRTANGVPVAINSTGDAQVVVGAGGTVQGIQAGVTITNSIARTAAEVDDSADALATTLTLSPVTVNGGAGRRVAISGAAPVDLRDSAARSLTVDTGAAGAQVAVQTNDTNPVALVVHADNTDVSVTSGVIGLDSPQTIRNLTLAGGELRGAGDLTVTGTFTWTGGALSGPGRTIAQGTMALGGGTKTLSGRTLVNAGTASWTGGDISASSRAAFVNQLGAVLDIQSDAAFTDDGTSIFTNGGTVQKSAGTGTTALSVFFTNGGVVAVNTGTWSQGSGSSSGSFAVAAGATLQFSRPNTSFSFTASSDLSGDGRVQLGNGGATVTFAGSYRVATTGIDINGRAIFDADASTNSLTLVFGGTLAGAGTLTVNGQLTWTGGTMSGIGRTVVLGGLALSGGDRSLIGRSLDNFGTAVWTGGEIDLDGGARLDNLDGALFDIQTDNEVRLLGGASAFTNAGTLRKSAGAGTTTFRFLAFNNNGTVEILSGTLDLTGGGTSTGSFTIQAGAALTFSDGVSVLTGSSTVAGDGQVNFTGSFAVVLGSYAVTGGTAVRNGTVSFLTTDPAGLGALTISGGTVDIFGTAAADTLTQSGVSRLGGTGTLTVTGLTTWSAGIMGDGGRTVALGGLRFSSSSTKTLDARIIDNAADAVWSGGDILPRDRGGVINNLAGATFDIQAGGQFGGLGESIFNNAGTLRKSAGTGTTNFFAALHNDGSVEVAAGTLAVGHPVGFTSSSTGSFTVQSGATFEFAAFHQHQLAASVTFAGSGRVLMNGPVTYAGDLTLSADALTLTVGASLTVTGRFTQTGGNTTLAGGTLSAAGGVSLQGGTLSGSGTIVGDVINAASIIVGDALNIGMLSITGDYTQTSAASLTLKLGGTASGRFDRLTVGGTATLAGTLTVRLVNGYMPATGDSMRVLTAHSLMGTFDGLAGDGPLFDAQYDGTGLTLRKT